jgi:hypothetical protein
MKADLMNLFEFILSGVVDCFPSRFAPLLCAVARLTTMMSDLLARHWFWREKST